MEALIGAIIGAVAALAGTWFSTKHSARVQMNAAVLSTLFPARLDAYQKFEAAIEEWSNSKTATSCAAVYRAGYMVALVSSNETTADLNKVLNYIRAFELKGILADIEQFQLAHVKLLVSMNHDLMHISIPSIQYVNKQAKSTKKSCGSSAQNS